MRPKYKIFDIDEDFINEILDNLIEMYRNMTESGRMFNKNMDQKLTPVKKYDPFKDRKMRFKFPLAYHVWIMYYFTKSKVSLIIDIEESLVVVEGLIKDNPFLRHFDYEIDYTDWINSKIGFLVYLTELKLRLLNGQDFSAAEMGALIGCTGQAIINRIKRGTAEGKKDKRSNQWIISNEEARRMIVESDSPILIDEKIPNKVLKNIKEQFDKGN